MNTYKNLKALFEEKYSFKSLKNISFLELKNELQAKIGSVDKNIEFFLDESKQRDLSLKFHWGHDHDFGNGLFLPGRMRDRHIKIMAGFIDGFGLETTLSGKKVLDIGVWTGGTSLLLAAMGAKVIAIEEVVKYCQMVNYLAYAFGIENNLACYPKSLYDFLPQFYDEFDLVVYSGVIYHVTDPLLSLRMIFSSLKDKGKVFIETFGMKSDESICRYEGPAVIRNGTAEEKNRGGWNYFIPSPLCLETWCKDVGFRDVKVGPEIKSTRILAAATRSYFQDFCRAGISKTSCR